MHTSAPKSSISILMPVKNAEPWVEACIQSIINQTHKNWELIIVNDGCTKSSGSTIQGRELFQLYRPL